MRKVNKNVFKTLSVRMYALMPVTTCLLCGSADLKLILDLGLHPLADTFLKKEELSEPEEKYPLQVLLCGDCGHTMTGFIVPPQKRYQAHDYSYDSQNSEVSVQHFEDMAADVIAREGVGAEDLVVDIGSSVGTLLAAFRAQSGSKILGVEPSHNIAALATQNGVPTINDFWSKVAVDEVVKQGGAKIITATNAFNHIGDMSAFMQDVERALVSGGLPAQAGAFVAEVPYMLHLVQKLAFDTIYLEHMSYFAIKPLARFFKNLGMTITDIQENEYMGGSIRITVKKGGEETPLVKTYIAREEAAGLFVAGTYQRMMQNIQQFKLNLMAELTAAKHSGGTVIGIGAATKGNTLLHYCGIDTSLLEFITDTSSLKIGKYTPGSHIPIVSDDAITDAVTHALILPWNIAPFLKEKLGPKYPKIAFIVPHM
ncbi:class I SAM-dependent methyltransferase [Patescibacteria group bacterium]|nr:class I SAM-dependent methyltransferase [Patescibacteria group bacterium]